MPNGNGKHQAGAQNTSSALTPRQEMAARELVKGAKLVDTARAAGVSRTTLFRWMRDPEFIAWLNRWRTAVAETARYQLFAAVGDAVATLAAAARDDEKSAAVLLRGLGVLSPAPLGSGDAQLVARQMEQAERIDRARLDRREAELDDYESDTLTGNFGDPEAQDAEDDLDDGDGGDTEDTAALHQRVVEELKARRAVQASPPAAEAMQGVLLPDPLSVDSPIPGAIPSTATQTNRRESM